MITWAAENGHYGFNTEHYYDGKGQFGHRHAGQRSVNITTIPPVMFALFIQPIVIISAA